MLTEEEKIKLGHRLHRISGQVEGIERMIEEGRYCIDILRQIGAARSALENVGMFILESHAKSCVVSAIREDRGEEAIEEMMAVIKAVKK